MSSCSTRRGLERSLVTALALAASACGGSDCPFDPLDPGCLTPVQAEAPPRALVFASGRNAGIDAYAANADGTDVVRLTTTGGTAGPAGRRTAPVSCSPSGAGTTVSHSGKRRDS
jgi:hypothetical protein